MATITWRNVTGAEDVARASIPLTQASQMIMGGIDKLSNTLGDYQNNRKEATTDAFMDKLAQYQTPEQLQQAMASGELNAFRQQLGSLIDRDAVRTAPQDQLAKLMQQRTAAQTYEDNQTLRGQREQENALRTLIALDPTKAKAAVESADGLINQGKLAEQWRTTFQDAAKTNADLARTNLVNQKAELEINAAKQAKTVDSRLGNLMLKLGTQVVNKGITPEMASNAVWAEVENLRREGVSPTVLNEFVRANHESLMGFSKEGWGPEAVSKRLAATALQEDVKNHPLANQPTTAKDRLDGLLKTINDRDGMTENFLGRDDKEALQSAVARNANRTITVKGPSGKPREVMIPYSWIQQAVLRARDSGVIGTNIDTNFETILNNMIKDKNNLSQLEEFIGLEAGLLNASQQSKGK